MQRTYVVLLALGAIGLAGVSIAQRAEPGAGAGWTGITEPEEVIEARRVLMLRIEQLMRPIDELSAGGQADPEALKLAGATIEAMLLAFPHLFPPTTNLFDASVLEPPTITLPALWEDFSTFLSLAESAEHAAAAVAEAEDLEALRTAGRGLRATCDGCHALFTKPYTPPVFTDEDFEFDFDSVFEQD